MRGLDRRRVFAAWALAWNLVGREEVAVDGRALAIRRAAGPFGRTRRFDLSQVRALRVEAQPAASPPTGSAPGPARGRAAPALDVGSRTVHLGAGLGDQDLATVLDALRGRLPARTAF